jgi:polyisoprenyl-teichoic acid--peptidoglycan teichoic acid transferase
VASSRSRRAAPVPPAEPEPGLSPDPVPPAEPEPGRSPDPVPPAEPEPVRPAVGGVDPTATAPPEGPAPVVPPPVGATAAPGEVAGAAPRQPLARTGAPTGTVRRRARRRLVIGLGLLALVALAVVVATSGLVDRAMEIVAPAEDDVPTATPASVGGTQPSIVVVTHDEADPEGRATGVLVLAADRETGDGTVLLVPTATVADVPGSGSFQLAEAHAFDGAGLVAASLENLMEVRFDGVVSLSEAGWSALLTRVGGFEVDVRSRLVAPAEDGGGQVRFEPGPQFLDGPRLAELLVFRAEGETELEALPRTQQVVTGMLERIVEEPALLDEVFADGAPMLAATDPELVRDVFALLAEARAEDRLTTLTLPVATMGTGRDDLYRPDADRVTALVDERLAASRPTDAAGVGRSVQILNGNGVPGIGQQVAAALRDGGYRILLTGNADHFDHEVTRIVIYDDSDASLAVARDVQERLGVGEVERSGTPQSVVDLTIVVGADFPPEG